MSAAELNPPTPTFDHLGPPKWWQCPRCALHVLMFPALPSNHVCANANPNVSVRTFYYYYELAPDGLIHALVLVGAVADDPLLRVTSFVGGALVPWERREKNGALWFYPPDPCRAGYADIGFDDRIQRCESAPREELEYRASRGRHSA